MGALFGGRCFASASDARDALYSGVGPAICPGPAIGPGSPPVVSVIAFDEVRGWEVLSYQAGRLLYSSPAPEVSFLACEPSDSVADGVALGWLVLAVWAGAWAVRYLGRALIR